MMVLIELIRAALGVTENVAYDATIDSRKLIKIIEKNKIVSMVWPVIARQQEPAWQEIATEMKKSYEQNLHKTLVQQLEIESLLEEMEEMGMDCLPLKGYHMRNYYPDPAMRSMTDFDVLIKDFDAEQIRCWMERVGYEALHVGGENHDVYKKKPCMLVELHKRLSNESLEKEMPQIYGWLSRIWERCTLEECRNHIFRLSEEDFYIYHLIHAYKHARIAGAGIRPLVDIYVFMRQARQRLDWDYLNRVLKELDLGQFERVMRELADKCFSSVSAELETDDIKLLEFFINSGLFGKQCTLTAVEVVKATGKTRMKQRLSVAWKMTFPKRDFMQIQYPILEKYPVLMPSMWIVRIFRVLFRQRSKLKRFEYVQSQEAYDEVSEIFRIAGLK